VRESFFPNAISAALFEERYRRGRFRLLPYHVVGRGSCEGYFVFDGSAPLGKGARSCPSSLESAAAELERIAAAEGQTP